MKKHSLALVAVVGTLIFLCGCARNQIAPQSLTPTAMTPPLLNRANVCSINTNFSRQSESKEYVLELSKVPAVYQPEIKFYTVNALNYLGLRESTASDLVITAELADSHLNIVPQNPRRERKTVNYMLTATEKSNRIWSIATGCSGRASEVSNYWFPGLVAAFLPYFGENRNRPIAIGKYPIYLNAVSTPPAK